MSTESGTPSRAAKNDRVAPYSEEAEKGVLGSILLDSGRVMDICIEKQLIDRSFYVPSHQRIYEGMRAMASKGEVIDVVTLSSHLKTSGMIDSVGGTIYLEQLVDSCPTSAHAEYYIDIVRQKHILRSIIGAARNAEQKCYDTQIDADKVLSEVEQTFLNITENQRSSVVQWPEVVKDTIQQIEKILTTRKGIFGLSTGFLNLDQKLHGLKSPDMIVLAARPSMGKTSLAMNIAENIALGIGDADRTPHRVGVFTLEMSAESLALRMLCSHAGVSSFHLTAGRLPSNTTHGKIMQAADLISKAPLFIEDPGGGLDIDELRAKARRMKKMYNVEIIVIDYLQCLNANKQSWEGRQQETAKISQNIKSMAKELKIPVLVLSQLSRAPEQRDKLGQPKLSDLRDSGAIEQDADVVLMMRRPCMYPDDTRSSDTSLAVIDIAKHRNGPTGEVEMNFDAETMRFSDRAHGVDGEEEATSRELEIDG